MFLSSHAPREEGSPITAFIVEDQADHPLATFRTQPDPYMPTPLLNVRSRVGSGKHLLFASISGFNPEQTKDGPSPRQGRLSEWV